VGWASPRNPLALYFAGAGSLDRLQIVGAGRHLEEQLEHWPTPAFFWFKREEGWCWPAEIL